MRRYQLLVLVRADLGQYLRRTRISRHQYTDGRRLAHLRRFRLHCILLQTRGARLITLLHAVLLVITNRAMIKSLLYIHTYINSRLFPIGVGKPTDLVTIITFILLSPVHVHTSGLPSLFSKP